MITLSFHSRSLIKWIFFLFSTACGCKSEYSLGFGCNAQTGQCECLPGVIGEKCNQCPHRWAFVDDVGCHECDSCTDNLLDDTDYLQSLIDPAIFEFDVSNKITNCYSKEI